MKRIDKVELFIQILRLLEIWHQSDELRHAIADLLKEVCCNEDECNQLAARILDELVNVYISIETGELLPEKSQL